MLSLKLLGGFRVRLPSGADLTFSTRKAQALVAYLALHPGQAQSRTKLATLLWGDTPDAQARQSLRQVPSDLRKGLAKVKPEVLQSRGENIVLNPDAVDVDVVTFAAIKAQLELGRTHLALAELACTQKNLEATAVHLNEAREVFRALDLPRWVERTEQLVSSFGVGLQR